VAVLSPTPTRGRKSITHSRCQVPNRRSARQGGGRRRPLMVPTTPRPPSGAFSVAVDAARLGGEHTASGQPVGHQLVVSPAIEDRGCGARGIELARDGPIEQLLWSACAAPKQPLSKYNGWNSAPTTPGMSCGRLSRRGRRVRRPRARGASGTLRSRAPRSSRCGGGARTACPPP
jgi:hypothetical protein